MPKKRNWNWSAARRSIFTINHHLLSVSRPDVSRCGDEENVLVLMEIELLEWEVELRTLVVGDETHC